MSSMVSRLPFLSAILNVLAKLFDIFLAAGRTSNWSVCSYSMLRKLEKLSPSLGTICPLPSSTISDKDSSPVAGLNVGLVFLKVANVPSFSTRQASISEEYLPVGPLPPSLFLNNSNCLLYSSAKSNILPVPDVVFCRIML